MAQFNILATLKNSYKIKTILNTFNIAKLVFNIKNLIILNKYIKQQKILLTRVLLYIS